MPRGAEFRRIVKFGVVGFSGVFVNLAVSEGLFRLALLGISDETARLAVANALGVVVSIFTNFLLNDRWTWGDRVKGGQSDWLRRLLKYYVLASVAGVLQVGVSSAAFEFFWQPLALQLGTLKLDSTLAICTGIGAGMVINFVASHFWAFKDAEAKP
jgi:putative flippase GtrA